MTTDELQGLVHEIVAKAHRLTVAYTNEHEAPVNYACVFAHSQAGFDELVQAAQQLGPVVENTAMGPVFHITPLATEAGPLRLLKIRQPDTKRREIGDADFTVADYEAFKKTYLGKSGFRLIQRPTMEMLELSDPAFDALAYYSHPTLAEVLRIEAKIG